MKAKIRLNSTHPFFSYILMGMEVKEENQIQTMAVNAYGDLFYNAEFADKLSGAIDSARFDKNV